MRMRLAGGALGAIVALVAASLGCADKQAGAEPVRGRSASLTTVEVAPVAARDQSFTVLYSGRSEAVQDASLGFVTPGRIDALRYAVGSRVKKGAVLARQDQASLALSTEQAEAALRVARSSETAASRELARTTGLVENGAATASMLDKNRDTLDLAASQAHQAEVALKLARRRVVDAELRAPFDGVVAEVNGRLGEVWSPSSPRPLVRLVDVAQLKVLVEMPAAAALVLELPSPVVVSAAGLEVGGTLDSLRPVADNRTGTITGEILIPEPQRLVPGIEVQVRLSIERKAALSVPDSALVFRDAKVFCYVVEAGVARRRELSLGLQSDGSTEVLTGLKTGEVVVVGGASLLMDGQAVAMVERPR